MGKGEGTSNNINNRSGDNVAVEELGVSQGIAPEVHEGLEAGLGKVACAGNVSISMTEEEYTGVAFFFSASCFKYYYLIL